MNILFEVDNCIFGSYFSLISTSQYRMYGIEECQMVVKHIECNCYTQYDAAFSYC